MSSSDRLDGIRDLAGEILRSGDPVSVSVTFGPSARVQHDSTIRPLADAPEPLPTDAATPTWTSDCQRVDWPEVGRFLFAPLQARVVKYMLEATLRGRPFCDQKAILRAVNSSAARLVDLFRRSPAWGRLILGAGNGRYRLPEWPIEDLENIPLD